MSYSLLEVPFVPTLKPGGARWGARPLLTFGVLACQLPTFHVPSNQGSSLYQLWPKVERPTRSQLPCPSGRPSSPAAPLACPRGDGTLDLVTSRCGLCSGPARQWSETWVPSRPSPGGGPSVRGGRQTHRDSSRLGWVLSSEHWSPLGGPLQPFQGDGLVPSPPLAGRAPSST